MPDPAGAVGVHQVFLVHLDPQQSLAFYCDGLGLEVRDDVGSGAMRWLTLGPAGPGPTIVLSPPAADLGVTDEERRTVLDLMSKGLWGRVTVATDDLAATFARVEATGAEAIQEPAARATGVRDCAFLDPARNVVRIVEVPRESV